MGWLQRALVVAATLPGADGGAVVASGASVSASPPQARAISRIIAVASNALKSDFLFSMLGFVSPLLFPLRSLRFSSIKKGECQDTVSICALK